MEKLKYPIGHFECPDQITETHINEWITTLEKLPGKLEQLTRGLSDEQLNTPYRPGGWTIRQVVHHISDSHHHSYIRFKWAMTEDNPIIKAYNEQAWANQFDYEAPIEHSLQHIKAIHTKLVYFLRGLKGKDLERTFIHPETRDVVVLNWNIGNYAWHGNHHYAHVRNTMKQNGWLE